MNRSIRALIVFVIVVFIMAGTGSFVWQQISGRCASEKEIATLFDHWNRSLLTGDPHKVVALYAKRSILLPTLSDKVRSTPDEKEDYFRHFLKKKPFARIDLRQIETTPNMAVDSGLYTFTLAKTNEKIKARYSFTYKWDGKQWLIVSHHSSLMPVKK